MRNNEQLSVISPLGDFVKRESFGGLLIIFSAVLGLLFANTGLRDVYRSFLEASFSIQIST
uniref:Na+/H+ antiporter NhaA n=1 Tax=Candidatus Planktophila sp. TaxID=2175601 RepID=UPI00404BA02E